MKKKIPNIEWAEIPVPEATVHLDDGMMGYWAAVPATWTEDDVLDAFLATADYDETPRIRVTLRAGNEGAACFAQCEVTPDA